MHVAGRADGVDQNGNIRLLRAAVGARRAAAGGAGAAPLLCGGDLSDHFGENSWLD